MTYTATLFGSAAVFRPREGIKKLAEVNELIDETLDNFGTFEGTLKRVDSADYNEQLIRKKTLREADMFGHLPRIKEEARGNDKYSE